MLIAGGVVKVLAALVIGLILPACGGSPMHRTAYADKCVPDWYLVAATDNGRYVAVRSADPTADPGDVWIDRDTCAQVR